MRAFSGWPEYLIAEFRRLQAAALPLNIPPLRLPPSGTIPLWWPISAPQQAVLDSSAELLLFAGESGGGKTNVLVNDAAQEHNNPALRGLLLRTTLAEMQELEHLQQQLYERRPYNARWKTTRGVGRWVFPAGGWIRPGYLAQDKHLARYQGNPYTYLGVDEAGQHPEHRIRRMIAWLTAPESSGIFARGRFTANPGGVGHAWEQKVFLRNRCPVHYPAPPDDSNPYETSVIPGRVYKGATWTDDAPVHKTTCFIPSRLIDNPFYGRSKFEGLLSQPKAIQQQLLYGCWCNAAGLYFDFLRPDAVVPYATVGDAWWWVHYISIDYGFSNSAAAAGMYAVHPNGTVFKTRERVERKMGAVEFAKRICTKGFDAVDSPKQAASTHWLRKLHPRDPERPRIAFCVMDEAMDQHRGQGKSIYDEMAEVFAASQIPCVKASHGPESNAQVLYNGLQNSRIVLTRDGAELPMSYRSVSTRIVDERKAVKKIHGAWEDDVYDETAYGYNTWRGNSEQPERSKLADEIAEMRRSGIDETTIARIAFQREQAIAAEEQRRAKGVQLARRMKPKGKRG